MRTSTILGLAILTVIFAPAALAGCWTCGGDGCCTEAAQGTSGRAGCGNGTICIGGNCACYGCTQSGSACAGTAKPECDSPYGACEEHQSLRSVPNGGALEGLLQGAPGVEAEGGGDAGGVTGVACSAV